MAMYIRGLIKYTRYDSEISAWETWHKENHKYGRKHNHEGTIYIIQKKKRGGGIPNKREMVKPFTTPVRGDKSKYRLFGIRSQLWMKREKLAVTPAHVTDGEYDLEFVVLGWRWFCDSGHWARPNDIVDCHSWGGSAAGVSWAQQAARPSAQGITHSEESCTIECPWCWGGETASNPVTSLDVSFSC